MATNRVRSVNSARDSAKGESAGMSRTVARLEEERDVDDGFEICATEVPSGGGWVGKNE